MRNCSIQNTVTAFSQTSSGSPNLIASNIDLSVTCFLDTQSGTARVSLIGPQRWGTVTTKVASGGSPVITQLNGRVGSFITASKGTGTLVSGTTTTAITFTTALDITPGANDIAINFTSSSGGSLGSWWINPITTTGFTLNALTAPTTGTTFAYYVNIS